MNQELQAVTVHEGHEDRWQDRQEGQPSGPDPRQVASERLVRIQVDGLRYVGIGGSRGAKRQVARAQTRVVILAWNVYHNVGKEATDCELDIRSGRSIALRCGA